MSMGYNFRVVAFHYNPAQARAHVMVQNNGVAPCYQDLYVSVSGQRASESLRRLQPGETHSYYVDNCHATAPLSEGQGFTIEVLPLAIVGEKLLPGQVVQYEAVLNGAEAFHPMSQVDLVSRYSFFPWAVPAGQPINSQ